MGEAGEGAETLFSPLMSTNTQLPSYTGRPGPLTSLLLQPRGWTRGTPPLSLPCPLPSCTSSSRAKPTHPDPPLCPGSLPRPRAAQLSLSPSWALRLPAPLMNCQHSHSGPGVSTCSPRSEQEGSVAPSVVLHPGPSARH